MASSASSAGTLDPERLLPLIPCPYCRDKIVTYVAQRGQYPGTRFYKCCQRDAGNCTFFEWQPMYAGRMVAAGVDISAARHATSGQAAPPPQVAQPFIAEQEARSNVSLASNGDVKKVDSTTLPPPQLPPPPASSAQAPSFAAQLPVLNLIIGVINLMVSVLCLAVLFAIMVNLYSA